MTPDFPVISIYKNRGLEIFKDDSNFRKITTYMFLTQDPDDCTFYDRNGQKWNFLYVNGNVKNDFKTRLLAKTIYNPVIAVDKKWKSIGRYNYDELKKKIIECVNDDDDCLTQFEEADVINNSIKASDNFEDIMFNLNRYIFDVDEEKLWKEQEER